MIRAINKDDLNMYFDSDGFCHHKGDIRVNPPAKILWNAGGNTV